MQYFSTIFDNIRHHLTICILIKSSPGWWKFRGDFFVDFCNFFVWIEGIRFHLPTHDTIFLLLCEQTTIENIVGLVQFRLTLDLTTFHVSVKNVTNITSLYFLCKMIHVKKRVTCCCSYPFGGSKTIDWSEINQTWIIKHKLHTLFQNILNLQIFIVQNVVNYSKKFFQYLWSR